jgi:class 3 adenylate cyclase
MQKDIYSCPDFIKQFNDKKQCIKPKKFNNLFVLFADIVGFTTMVNKHKQSADSLFEIYNLLHAIFTDFDLLCDKFAIHKVETIGDCYMAISGLYDENENHENIIFFALALLSIVNEKYKDIKIRIGIAYGDCIMGMLGLNNTKVSFLGNCINYASRLQNFANDNSIVICEDSYELLNGGPWKFQQKRADIKGIGNKNTYDLYVTNTYHYNETQNDKKIKTSEFQFKRTILIVDDSQVILKIMKNEFMNHYNINVDTCDNLQDMIDKLNHYYYDAILLDNFFDNSMKTGVEVADELRLETKTLVCIFSGNKLEVREPHLFIQKPWKKMDYELFLSKIELNS